MGHSVGEAAKRSTAKGMVERKIERTEEQLIAELRNDRASHIWPSVPAIDALLQAYDNLRQAYVDKVNELENKESIITSLSESNKTQAEQVLQLLGRNSNG